MPKKETEERRSQTSGNGSDSEDSVLYREMTLRVDQELLSSRAETGTDERIPIALSSEHPVERFDWWEGERYLEVLDHSSSAVDLSRAGDGLPLLLDHSTRSQIGLIEDVRVDKDRVLRGEMRFSRGQQGTEIKQDVVDRIRTKVSVGYMIDRNNLEKTQGEDDKMPTVRVKRWTPMEGSIVPIPADPTVGVGRSKEEAEKLVATWTEEFKKKLRQGADGGAPSDKSPTNEPAPEARENAMAKEATAAESNGAATVLVGEDALKEERKRAQDITELCAEHGVSERAAGFIEKGISADRAGREILALKGEPKPVAQPESQSHLEGLSEKEKREYSVVRALNAVASGKWDRETSLEREVHEAAAKNLGRDSGGILVPTDLPMGKRQLNAGTATEGQELVPTVHGSFIDFLRTRMVATRLGAQFLTGLRGNIDLPKQTGAGQFSWREEVPATDLGDTYLETDVVKLSPKAGSSTTAFSRQLLAQSVPSIEGIVRNDLLAIVQRGIDRAALHGSGTNDEPLGVYNAPDVNAVPFAGPISWTNVVEMETVVRADDADIGVMGYATTPEVRGAAKTILKAEGAGGESAGSFIWMGGIEGEMNGFQAMASNQLAKNLGVGTNEHGLIFGVWDQLIIGEWGAMELITDIFAQKKRGLIEVTIYLLADVALRHGEAFSKATGLTVA